MLALLYRLLTWLLHPRGTVMPDPYARPADAIRADLTNAWHRYTQATHNRDHATNAAALAQRDVIRYTADRNAALRSIDALLDEHLDNADHQLADLAGQLVSP